jgi:hypothetical protein
MYNDGHDNIFDEDDALDFIIYKEVEKQTPEQNSRKGGYLGIILLLLLPVVSVIFFH